jgi:small subunit ribosomal protein S6
MLHRYEALMLAVPEVTQDEARSIEAAIEKAVKENKGGFISFERWGKFRLAYPVQKNEYGVYFLTRFEAPEGSNVLDEVRLLFSIKLHNIVMRSVLNRLSDEGSLEYQRPKSVEESPTRDVKTFLKENKMEGLLSSVDRKEAGRDFEPRRKPAHVEGEAMELDEDLGFDEDTEDEE